MELEKVGKISLKAGEILLKNGSDTHRIEETVTLICKAYGYDVECVSLPYGIFLEFTNADPLKEKSMMKKVKGLDFDLHKIELVNAFSRQLCNEPMEYTKALDKLKEIESSPSFNTFTLAVAAAITGAAYTLIFGGSFFDTAASALICAFVEFIISKTTAKGILQYIINFSSGFIMGILALTFSHFIPVLNSHFINMGSIMILVPGIILTNGIKDFIYGHYSSGLGKIFNALLIVSTVAVGVGFALVLYKGGASL